MEDKTTAVTFTFRDFFGPMAKVWPAMAVIAVILILAQLEMLGFGIAETLRYTDNQPGYRWLTAHYVHLGANHALMNVAAALMLMRIFRDVWERWHWWVLAIVMPTSICATFYVVDYNLSWYVGLSGALHGWFAWCCVLLWKREKGFVFIGVIGLLLKLGIEHYYPSSLPSEDMIGGSVITLAHRLGALYGLIFALLAVVIAGYKFNKEKLL
ncbi:MAG: rhomboid family GlyGly-CTERM serine protease [Gammaproteobacteria bacterium]|jgi:rhomboid family GlyGly-CTERM serine protease